jgi:mono/diheme cytochrome c family protein
MKYIALILLVATIVVFGTAFSAQATKTENRPNADHGRYIVHHVAMCIQCHTPRDAHGQLIEAKLLQGEALPVASPFKDVRWAFRAPHIAGLPGYTKEQALRLLTTGIAANGAAPLGPMPPFRMTREDAEDVIAYLSSLD